MKVRLGYVALPLTIAITSSSTITYTRYRELDNGMDRIFSIIPKNLDSLFEILKYNSRNGIHFYRMTSNLIPLATLKEVYFDYINPYLPLYKKIGSFILLNKIRVDMHPDQFAVLNSTNPLTVSNCNDILMYHKSLLEAFSLVSPKLILHIGSSQGGKKASVTRFMNNYKKLDPKLQNMIIIENDDKTFDIKDTLNLCKRLNIPMVLDYHHYLCNNSGELLNNYLKEIFNTWSTDFWCPKVHFSSPKRKTKKEFRSHHDFIDVDEFINFLELAKQHTNELDIMIEAKQKDFALFKLIRELKYKTDYVFLDETTFLVQ